MIGVTEENLSDEDNCDNLKTAQFSVTSRRENMVKSVSGIMDLIGKLSEFHNSAEIIFYSIEFSVISNSFGPDLRKDGLHKLFPILAVCTALHTSGHFKRVLIPKI